MKGHIPINSPSDIVEFDLYNRALEAEEKAKGLTMDDWYDAMIQYQAYRGEHPELKYHIPTFEHSSRNNIGVILGNEGGDIVTISGESVVFRPEKEPKVILGNITIHRT